MTIHTLIAFHNRQARWFKGSNSEHLYVFHREAAEYLERLKVVAADLANEKQ